MYAYQAESVLAEKIETCLFKFPLIRWAVGSGFENIFVVLDIVGDGTVFRQGYHSVDLCFDANAVQRLTLPPPAYFSGCLESPDWQSRLACLRATPFADPLEPHQRPPRRTPPWYSPAMSADPPPDLEREQTDAALRAERANADRALAAERAAVNAGVDRAVHATRDDADARVNAAREETDHNLEKVDTPEQALASVAELRAFEDAALAEERATFDELLRIERDHARALAALLPLERDRTDRHLHTERDRSDAAVAHRDNFLGMVSHDLRNLLGGILNSAELLARQPGENSAQILVNVDRIRRYTARMNRLIGDLLDVTSIDAGQLAVAPTAGDPAATIAEAIELFRAPAAARRITVESQVPPGRFQARFDADRLLQVFANLISNSVKFTPDGGRVVVTADESPGFVRFTVTDSGRGIPEPLLERIFERFWQVGEHDNRGMGLGLYISRCIVDAHGGRIWAESRISEYSAIHLTLPAA